MLADRRKILRSGYTTGACAAAAAKAAALKLMSSEFEVQGSGKVQTVEIPFPDGSRVKFKINNSELIIHNSKLAAWASVIKDAGDDPDVTNGAEIVAEVTLKESNEPLTIKGGKGVGVMTKPGLSMPVGEAAINPVPRRMIKEAVMEAVKDSNELLSLEITISVPHGDILAKKTLNPRLGIVGGISILGTTGIVKPISTEAWTASISASMDVARAMGHDELVLSAGRVSEKAHMRKYNFPEEAYVMMGDYLEFSFLEAGKHGFRRIHLCAQWAKMLKIGMATPQTHIRHGAIDVKKAMEFLEGMGYISGTADHEFNTAREIFDLIRSTSGAQITPILSKVCSAARKYTGGIVPGIPIIAHLVSYEEDIIANSE